MEEIERILNSRLPCLLDVLIFACVSLLCSVVPPSPTPLPDLVEGDPARPLTPAAAANCHIRLMTGEVLKLITEVSPRAGLSFDTHIARSKM